MSETKTQTEKEQLLYAAVGRYISEWQKIEARLTVIFIRSIFTSRSEPTRAAYEVFQESIGAETKLKLIDAAISARFRKETEIINYWKNLHTNLSRAKEHRNKVAHGCLYYFDRGLNVEGPIWIRNPEYKIYTSFFNNYIDESGNIKIEKKEMYNLLDIEKETEKISVIFDALNDLSDKIFGLNCP
jgi:hypothetical protein